MFKHYANSRSFKNNLSIASLLSFTAGVVNVSGYLSIRQLTTNVTGHFAFFVEEVDRLKVWEGMIYLYYILFFLLGSFASNFIVEYMLKRNKEISFIVPVVIEIILLSVVGYFGDGLVMNHANIIAFTLLFTMGLQNALVTKISKASVRTTHLTGLFTDLGIELSQLFYFTTPAQRATLINSIKLRLTIILFFFIGGVVSGILYFRLQLNSLLIASLILTIGLFWNKIRLEWILIKRKLFNKEQKNSKLR